MAVLVQPVQFLSGDLNFALHLGHSDKDAALTSACLLACTLAICPS